MLGEHFRRHVRMTRIDRRPFAYQTSTAIDTLDIELDDGTRLNLLIKDLSRAGLHAAASRTKPDFLHNPLREIEVYHQILAENPAGTAVYYGSVVDADSGRYWLLLERVDGRELYQIGEGRLWEAAAQWLARLHCHWMGRGDELQKRAPLLNYNAQHYRMWLERAAEFQTRRAPGSGAWQRLMEGYDRVVERLTSLPKTFLHGEFYASNVLIAEPKPNKADKESDEKPRARSDRPHSNPGYPLAGAEGEGTTAIPVTQQEGASVRVCAVDWEMAAIGPGLMDVAALTAGKWSDQERTALLETYRIGLEECCAGQGSLHELQRDLDSCRLHVAVQWLGWSPNWTPPAEHRHDWLAEAIHLVEKLGL